MKRTNLADMTVDQLVERFTAIALDQDRALLRNEIGKFNRLFDEMEAVKRDLRARNGDQRRAFRQSGSVLKHLFGEGLHSDSSELVEVWLYI